jgi:hypothetical protein
MEATVFLLLALSTGALGGPVNWRYQDAGDAASSMGLQCATHCTASNKFQYETGKTYNYQYETTISTGLNGVTDGAARIEVKATASISVLSKCEMSLSLSGVTTASSVPDKSELKIVEDWNWKSALETNDLRFSFQDGRVEDVCPSGREETRSLNFKRGVLSAFQNSMNQHERDESMKEIDVAGVCPTEYSVTQKGWKSQQFTKTKDLLGCSDRHDYRTSLQSTLFHSPDTIQSLPLLKGSHRCVHTVSKEGFVQSTLCTEALVFRPFSRQEAGAKTDLTQKLTYSSTTASVPKRTEPLSGRTTLLFEHEQKIGSNDQTLWSAREKLTELCRITIHDITPEVPGLFADLVYLMKGLESKELLDLADRVQRGNCEDNKSKAQKFYQDALPMVGTTASVEVMTGMLLSQEVTGTQADVWITSFHFVQKPTVNMLSPLKNLLLSESHRLSSLLPVTSLVKNFCRDQPSCLTLPQIGEIVNVLNDILGMDCQSEEQNLILTTLRAVGNLGFSDALVSTLEKCVKTPDNPINTKVIAVQAYRGLSCSVNRKTLMDTFLNTDEDSELRIAAYLGVMQCWDATVLSQVKTALGKEEVNQVGSFVWTHLSNLMETSSLHKQALKDILYDEELQKEFNMDRRKYSRNYEVSFFSEKFGIGAMAESNLIWSSKSFAPRSAMANLTVDVLGHTVNLLEFGGRIQGLETMLQNYFGADGVFKGGEKPKDNVQSRCVKQEKMDNIKKKFSVDRDELTASVYLRMFGNELGFQHFTEKDLTSLKNKYSITEILATLAKGQDVSFTKSAMFMDTSVSVPTIAGMALTLSVNGTASVELIASAKMDLKKFSMRKMEAKFDFRPSGAVQISGMMSIDMGISRAGLKMVTTLHTSTSLSGSLDLTNGQVLSVDLDTPKRNNDILDVKSEIFLLHNKAEVKQDNTKNAKVLKSSCSSESVLKVLGYELCGAVSFVNATADSASPYFPLTGPVSAGLTLHKKDVPKGFRLIGKLIHNKATSIAQLSFDTPGSLVERAINIGYFLDTTVKSAEVELNSPWKKILAKGTYTDEPKSRKFVANVLDDLREYIFQIQLDQNKQGQKTVYAPTLEISRPSDSKLLRNVPQKLSVGGTISVEDDYSDISGSASIKSGLDPDPIELKANYVSKKKQNTISGSVTLNQKKVYSATFEVMKDFGKGKFMSAKYEPTILISSPAWRPFLLSGTVDFKDSKAQTLDVNLQITMDKTLKQPINFKGDFTRNKRKNLNRFSGDSELSSQFGTVKVKGSVEHSADFSRKGSLFSSKINVDYNLPVLENKAYQKNKLVFEIKVLDNSTQAMRQYDVILNMDNKNNPDANFNSNFELTRKDAFTNAVFTLKSGPKAALKGDKTHDLRLELSLNPILKNHSADVRYGFQVLYPVKNIEYQINGKHVHEFKDLFTFETYVAFVFAKGKSVEIRVYGNKNNKKTNLDASGALELSFPGFEIVGKKYDSRSYKLATTVIQNSDKEYIHTVNLQVDTDLKHTLVTKYKRQSEDQFDLYSQLNAIRDPPLKLTIAASRNTDILKGSLEFFMDGDIYSGALNSRSQEAKYKVHSWDFVWPERRVKGSLEVGERTERNTVMKLESFWDADKDPTQKVVGDLSYSFEKGKKVEKSHFALTINTPFENHKIYSYKRQVDFTVKEFKDEFKVVWQKVDNELSYSFWILLPPNLERFEMKSKIVTPMEDYRRFGLDIVHKLYGSRYLSSSYKGTYNDDEMAVAVLIANTGDKIRNNIDSSFTIVSTLPKYRNIILKFTHNDDGRVYSSESVYERNGEQYKAKLDAKYFRIHYQVQVDSKVEISLPSEKPVVVTWVHTNSLTNLNSTVSLAWKPEYDTKFVVGAKVNQAEKDYALDITLNVPCNQMSILEIQLRHNQMSDNIGSYFIRLNKDPKWTGRGTYKYTGSEITYDFSNGNNQGKLIVKFKNYPYNLYFENSLRYEIRKWDEAKIVFEASVDKSYSDGWSTNAKLVTPWEEVKNVDLRANVQKLFQSQWKLDSIITLGVRKQITVDFNVDTDKLSKMNGLIKTPYKTVSSIVFGFSQNKIDKVYSSDMFIEVQPIFQKVRFEQSVSMEPDLIARLYLDLPDTEFKFIEINTNHVQQRRGYDTTLKVNYYPAKEINAHFNGKFNQDNFPENTKVILEVSTPFNDVPDFNIVGEIHKNEGKWIGLIDLNTAAEQLKNFQFKIIQANTDSSSYTDFVVESSLTEAVGVGMHFDWGDLAAANLTLNAPSVGHSTIGFKANSKSWTDFQQKIFAEFTGYTLDADIGLKHDENITKFWILYAYPGSDHSYLQTSFHRIGNSAHDFDVGGFLQVGKNSKPYNISMQYSFVDTKAALGTTLETPFTKSLSYLVKNEKQSTGEGITLLYGKYDTRFLLNTYLSHKITDKTLDINTRNHYLFDDKDHKSGTKLTASWSQDGQEAKVEAYCNDDWTTVQMSRKVVSNGDSNKDETLNVLVFTPYTDFTDIGMNYAIQIKNDDYHGSCNLEYMDDKEAVLKFDVTQPNQNQANVEATLTLPIENYNSNTFSYSHNKRRDQFTANAELVTGKGEQLDGKLEFKNNGDYTLTLTGPVEQFDSLTIAGKYNENERKVSGNANLLLTLSSKPVILEYDAEINNVAVLNCKLRSPFNDFKYADLAIQHDGQDWKQFKNKVLLKSDVFGQVTSDTTWRFTSITNMEGKTLLASSMKNMENLKFDFSTADSKDSQISQLNVGWQQGKEISVNNNFSLNKAGGKTKFSTNFGMSTPFPEIKTANLRASHMHLDEMYSEGIAIDHNDQTYLDADLSYQYEGKNEVIVEVRNPRPMALKVTGSSVNELLEGAVDFNWDKRDPEANLVITTSLADRSAYANIDTDFKLKIAHPVRVMAVDCLYKKANNEISTSGLLTWDKEKGNSFSYDVAWTNRTSVYGQMYEGHVKVGVPQRSVKVQSSYSNTDSSLTTSSSVWWDADRDDRKKVTMTTSVEERENLKRLGFNINLPSINKQLNVVGTTRGGSGSTICDSKAEISYSTDPRKLIIVTSKIGNSEVNSPGDYNYTMDIGFEHTITNTDIKLSSHFGNVGRVSSLGSRLAFLTTNNKIKNLDFWAKVDRAQRNLEVKVGTPLKTFGVEGHIENLSNQHHILLKSFEDDKQAMKLNVILDPRRQNMDIEFNYDQDDQNRIVKFTGNIVNNSAIRVDMSSQDGRQTTSETMIAVRLNNSHILNTHITWRPTLLHEMQTFIGTKLTAFSYAANDAFSKAKESAGSEVKAKYDVVSEELRSEMSQVFQLMDKEMESFNAQLEKLRTEFRRFYQRNDLHIRDMGEGMKAAFDGILKEIQEVVKNYRSYSNGVTEATNVWLAELKAYPIAQKYALAVQQLMVGLKSVQDVLEDALDDVAIELNKVSILSYRQYLEITRAIDRKLNSYTRSLYELPIYRKMMEQKLHMGQLGLVNISSWTHFYSYMYLTGQEMLQDQYHDIMSRPEFQHIHAVASEIHQQIMTWNLEQTMDAAIKGAVDLSKNLILMELIRLKNYLIDLEKTRVIVYDPQKGELQFEIHLPVPLKSLTEAPEINIQKYWNNMKKLMKSNLPSTNSSMWDVYYDYVPSLEPASYFTPYEASAYLIGGQHYITFDESHFDFLSTCSHVLTRDMRNDKFSAVVNYDHKSRRDGVKSLCFNIENSLNFEIFSDYRLEVNNRDIEMPFISDRVKIVRDGDFIHAQYAGGLDVYCNPKLEVYKVNLKGWHHGQVTGLFGKYDNEEVNDRISNQQAQNFEVNRRSCLKQNTALKPDPAIDLDNMCSAVFDESSSKFRPCFKQVDPAPFISMCQIYMAQMTENEAIRLATEQYRYVCSGHGVFSGPLEDYVPCNSDGPFIVEGNDPLYQSADVVFVIEDSICNQWAMPSLTSMVTEISNALINAGFKDNRFGLQGYGGLDQDDVTVRTINGQYFGEASLFLKAAETLKLSNGTGFGDLDSAIRSAVAYPYRPGVAKVLIIAPCSSCEVGLYQYNLAQSLASKGFSVHVLKEQGYHYEDENKAVKRLKIYGVDNSRIFSSVGLPATVKVKDVQGTKIPNYCDRLAETTNGSLFDTTHLSDKGHTQREFIQEFARRVGWSTVLPACQTCSCNADSDRVECQLCSEYPNFTYLPWKKPNIVEAIGLFHDFDHDVKSYFGFAK